MNLDLTHETPDGPKPIADLTEQEISGMEPGERVRIINAAQQHCAKGHEITVEQSANLMKCLIHVRRKQIADNPRATAAAKRAADVIPAALDDIP